jgi:hypothetical protein
MNFLGSKNIRRMEGQYIYRKNKNEEVSIWEWHCWKTRLHSWLQRIQGWGHHSSPFLFFFPLLLLLFYFLIINFQSHMSHVIILATSCCRIFNLFSSTTVLIDKSYQVFIVLNNFLEYSSTFKFIKILIYIRKWIISYFYIKLLTIN